MLRGGGGSGDNVHLTLCVVKSICESSLRGLEISLLKGLLHCFYSGVAYTDYFYFGASNEKYLYLR